MKTHRRIYDPNPFEIINEPNKFYLLGLIFADGCLSQDSDGFRITIGLKDKELLSKIQPYFCPDRKLYKQTTWADTIAYSIINKNINFIEVVKQYGVTERKSLTVCYPLVPKEFIPHFIRGYFDGDGSVFVYQKLPRNYLGCSFTSGSRSMLYGLQSEIKTAIHVEFLWQEHKDKAPQIRLYKTADIKQFASWLYKDADWFLERKHNIFIENNYLR